MAAIHPENCDEFKVDIAEEQQKKQAVGKSKKIPNQLSCKQIFGIITLCVFIYIAGCEMFSFGLKIINTTPKDAILYRYQILGSCLMIGVSFFGFIFICYGFLVLIFKEPVMKSVDRVEYYCTREQDLTSMPWYQRKRFVKIAVAICIFVFWFAMFEIGHVFYIIYESIKDKPDWSRPVIYFIVSIALVGFYSFVLGFSSLIMIGVWIVG